MIWFFIIAMLAAAMLMLLPPIWRAGRRGALDGDTANIAVLGTQLAELDAELDGGMLSQEQYARARDDLESSAAAELGESGDDAAHRPPSPRRRLTLGACVCVLLSAGSVGMYQATTTYHPPAAAADGQIAERPAVEEMIETLAARLRAEPQNAQGWTMLGRAYAVLQRYDEAAGAYAHAYRFGAAADADLAVDYAEALAFTNEGRMEGQPTELVTQALKHAPDHPKALWLAGFARFQDGDYQEALMNWRRVTENPTVGEDTRRMLQGYMAEAQDKLDTALAQSGQTPAAGEAQTPATAAADVATPTATADNNGVTIRAQVTIAESLASQVRPAETVFVFARAVTGPPLPLAVQKLTAADLPTTVVLDDTMAMVEGMNLSSQPRVIVGARVSRSGNPLPQPGDLQGLSAPITPTADTQTTVIINETVK